MDQLGQQQQQGGGGASGGSQISRTAGLPLSDFLMQLEDYNPTGCEDMSKGDVIELLKSYQDYRRSVPDPEEEGLDKPSAYAVTAFYLNSSGFEAADGRLIRLISLTAQKFDITNDALQHCKMRGSQQSSSKTKGKDKRYTLTMEDLTPVLAEYGITIKKPHYYI